MILYQVVARRRRLKRKKFYPTNQWCCEPVNQRTRWNKTRRSNLVRLQPFRKLENVSFFLWLFHFQWSLKVAMFQYLQNAMNRRAEVVRRFEHLEFQSKVKLFLQNLLVEFRLLNTQLISFNLKDETAICSFFWRFVLVRASRPAY